MRTSFFIRTLSFAALKADWLQTVLMILGMSLGIAVFCSIRLASESSSRSFDASARVLRSPDVISLTGSGGVPESLVAAVRNTPGVKSVSPFSNRFVEAYSNGKPLGSVQVIGVDLFSRAKPEREARPPIADRKVVFELLQNPKAVVTSAQLGQEIGRSEIELVVNATRERLSTIGALDKDALPPQFAGKVLLMDIAHFQELFHQYGRIDRLDVTPADGRNREKLAEGIRSILPAGVSTGDTESDIGNAERVTAAFRLNLNFLSAVALFSGVLLIYNTSSSLFLKRRRDFAVLRSVGASPRQLFSYLMCEAALLGGIASFVGLILGYILASQSVRMMARTISALYLPTEVLGVELSHRIVLECFALGPVLSILGTIIPASEIFVVPAREGLSYQTFENRFNKLVPALAIFGAVLLGITAAISGPALLEKDLRLGLLPPALLVSGVVLLVPLFLRLSVYAFSRIPVSLAGIETRLALDHIRLTLKRSSVAVAAVMVALGMYLGVTMMVESFRKTVAVWIDHITPADIYISSKGLSQGRGSGLSDELFQFVTTLPEVRDFDWITTQKVSAGGRPLLVHGTDLEKLLSSSRLMFRDKWTPDGKGDEIKRLAADQNTIFISEPFATHQNLDRGSRVTIPLLGNVESFSVRNVYFDYSSDQGAAYIPIERYRKIFGPEQKDGVSLYVNGSAEPVIEVINRRFADAGVVVRDNITLRREVLRVFDQTFAITQALKVIALIISAFTLFHVVLMLTIDRARDLGVFRTIGASRLQLVRMITAEAIVLGFTATASGIVVGIMIEALLIRVIHRFFFGWSMEMIIPVGVIAVTAALSLAVAFAASFLPAWINARKIDARVLRYE